MSEANKALVRRVFEEAFNERKVALIDELYRVLSASLRRAGFSSERVALGNPVMPIADSFGGGVVGIDSGQL